MANATQSLQNLESSAKQDETSGQEGLPAPGIHRGEPDGQEQVCEQVTESVGHSDRMLREFRCKRCPDDERHH